jgi:hypothetical protein
MKRTPKYGSRCTREPLVRQEGGRVIARAILPTVGERRGRIPPVDSGARSTSRWKWHQAVDARAVASGGGPAGGMRSAG